MDVNYLSDDDCIIDNQPEDDYGINYAGYDSEEFNDEMMDEEERKEYIEYQEYLKQQQILLWENSMRKNSSEATLYFQEKEKKVKEQKDKMQKKNKSMNFTEFNEYADKLVESNKPKKFVSQRLVEKKGVTSTDEQKKEEPSKCNRRTFNPRLPPYFKVNQRESYYKKY